MCHEWYPPHLWGFFRYHGLRRGFSTRVIRSLLSALQFLALVNLPQPPPSQADDQVNFMGLACACMTLHKFISWPGPCRGQIGLCLFLVWSSSESFELWFAPTFYFSGNSDWWILPDWLGFLNGVYRHVPVLGENLFNGPDTEVVCSPYHFF